MPAACVASSLQLSLSAKTIQQQAIFSCHHSTKHETLPLYFTEAWQDANQDRCSIH